MDLFRLGIGTRVRMDVREDFQNRKTLHVSEGLVDELTRGEERIDRNGHSRQTEQPVQKHGGERENRTSQSFDLM